MLALAPPSTLPPLPASAVQNLLRQKQCSAQENWSLCQGCTQCCEYVCIEIDRPARLQDVDHIVWYLVHRNVWVWVDEENKWYVQFNTPCGKLDDQGRCSWYGDRPKICQDYKQSQCPRYVQAPAEKFLFKDETDFLSWLGRHANKKMRLLHERYLAKRAVRWQSEK